MIAIIGNNATLESQIEARIMNEKALPEGAAKSFDPKDISFNAVIFPNETLNQMRATLRAHGKTVLRPYYNLRAISLLLT